MHNMYRAVRAHDWNAFLGLRPWKRHSFILAVAAVIYVMYGLTMIIQEPSPHRASGLALALRWMDLYYWGWVWVIIGMLTFISTRWPPASETWGYSAMAGLSALWGGFYALSMLFLQAPATGMIGMLIWTLVAFVWWGISGLRNPEDHLVPIPIDPIEAP